MKPTIRYWLIAIVATSALVAGPGVFAEKAFTSTAVACKAQWSTISQPDGSGGARLTILAKCAQQRYYTFTLKADGTVLDARGQAVVGPSALTVTAALAKLTLLDADLDNLSGAIAGAHAVDP